MVQTENVQLYPPRYPLLARYRPFFPPNNKRVPIPQRPSEPNAVAIPCRSFLVDEGIVDRQGNCRTHGGPAGLRDGSVLEANTEIPGQMPQAVDTVKEERHGDSKLG